MSCMNTMMMGQRQDDEDRAESLADAIEARAAELLMHGEACDPMDGFNIAEALGEASNNEKMVMAKVLAERKFDQAGILLDMISRTYWAKMADEMAERELS
jgi:lactam utilization protein B